MADERVSEYRRTCTNPVEEPFYREPKDFWKKPKNIVVIEIRINGQVLTVLHIGNVEEGVPGNTAEFRCGADYLSNRTLPKLIQLIYKQISI